MINECRELFFKYVDNIIAPKLETYEKEGFSFYIEDYRLFIVYKDVTYTVKIIKERNTFYWYLTPYKNSYFTTETYVSSFGLVLEAIKNDHTEMN